MLSSLKLIADPDTEAEGTGHRVSLPVKAGSVRDFRCVTIVIEHCQRILGKEVDAGVDLVPKLPEVVAKLESLDLEVASILDEVVVDVTIGSGKETCH